MAEFDTGTNPFLRRADDITGPDEAPCPRQRDTTCRLVVLGTR